MRPCSYLESYYLKYRYFLLRRVQSRIWQRAGGLGTTPAARYRFCYPLHAVLQAIYLDDQLAQQYIINNTIIDSDAGAGSRRLSCAEWSASVPRHRFFSAERRLAYRWWAR